MKKCVSLILTVLFLLAAMPVSAADVSEYQIFDLTVAVEENYDEIAAEIEILNQERAAHGLSPLVLDPQLTAWAMQRAAECTLYYSHTRPNGSDCFTVLGGKYQYGGAGENIAIGQRSAEEVMVDWMNSTGHRENILRAGYTSVGLGCVESVDGFKSWVQLFSTVSGTSHTPSGTVYREDVPVAAYNTVINCWWVLEKEGEWQVGDTVSGGLLAVNGGFPYSATLITGGYTVTSSSDCVRINEDGTMTAVKEGKATITATMGSGGGQVTAEITVTVVPSDTPVVILGDANGDGKVNNRDLGLLQQYLNSWGTEIDTTVMDVTNDGRVNNRDLGLLQQYLNGWGVTLG